MVLYKINVSHSAEAELKHTANILGLKTEEDVIIKALSLIKFVAEEMREGGKLIIENAARHSRKEVDEL
jgi:hypothetical protein